MSIQKLLAGRVSEQSSPVAEMAVALSSVTASRVTNDAQIGDIVLSTESLNDAKVKTLDSAYNSMESAIKAIASNMNFSLESHQLESAVIGGMVGTNVRKFLGAKLRQPSQQDAVVIYGSSAGSSAIGNDRPAIATEAYSDIENKNAQLNTILYNMLASKQDEFGETLFPTIVVNPNEIGLTILTKLFYVYNDFKRATSGALANYARKSIIRAYADPTILKNESTKLVPVLRTGGGASDNSAQFVPVAKVPSWTETVGVGISIPTGALKTDARLDLIGISQFDELLNSGLSGPTDTVHPALKLADIFVEFTDGTATDIVRIPVSKLPSSTFTYAPTGNTRRMILNIDTDGLVMNDHTTKVSGAALAYLTELATNSVRVQLTINGSVTLDKGDTIVSGGKLTLTTMRNAAGALVTGAGFNTLAGKFDSAKVLGFTLDAVRENASLRQRPQLLDSQSMYSVINVPYHAPIAALAPAAGNEQDTTAVQELISAVGMRMNNEAVACLTEFASFLAGFDAIPDANGELPQMDALGSLYVRPTFFTEPIDLTDVVDSVKSHEKIKDIRAAIVEKVRYYVNEMWRSSEYQAAATLLTGNTGFKPTVIVATDTVIHNYIMADGELRTLGENFDVKVVSTLNNTVKGKIFITFGVFDSARNTSVNALNSGQMLYSPEVVVQLPISRDGQVSNELIVTPRFKHSFNLPVMTVLEVTGLPEVTGKVTINMHSL